MLIDKNKDLASAHKKRQLKKKCRLIGDHTKVSDDKKVILKCGEETKGQSLCVCRFIFSLTNPVLISNSEE